MAFLPGQHVIWRHEMRGGYGYVEHIPGVVVKVPHDGNPIQIRVALKDGSQVDRWVRAENLQAKGRDHADA